MPTCWLPFASLSGYDRTMKSPRAPLFLERETYRRRRLMDAARILPVVGLVMILLPVLWTGREGGMTTAGESVYLFALWIALILAAGLLSRPLRAALRRETAPPTASTPAAPADPATKDQGRPDSAP